MCELITNVRATGEIPIDENLGKKQCPFGTACINVQCNFIAENKSLSCKLKDYTTFLINQKKKIIFIFLLKFILE